MPDFNTVSNNDFMIEKIKERPINRRKLLRRTLITACMAVLFGLIACVTILILEPVISNWLYPEEEAEVVEFPEDEDEEEMKPEDMLEKIPEPEIVIPPPPVNAQLDQEQVEEILSAVELNRTHYVQLYEVIRDYAEELRRQLVTVTGVSEEYDWMENSYEEKNDSTGVIIGNGSSSLYVLTNEQAIRNAEVIRVTMSDGKEAAAGLIGKYSDLDMAVLSVSLEELGLDGEDQEIPVATMGYSKSVSLVGSPVIALGSPMGTADSVGYGMVTGRSEKSVLEDNNLDVVITDIYGSQDAQGILFNMEGEIIGIIASAKINADMKNIVTAYGISDLDPLIKIICAGEPIPYLGIKGISVTREANEESGIPYGAYITEVTKDSPAMMAGLQKGDIIVGMDDALIAGYSDYERSMYNMKVDQEVKVKIMRFAQGIYKEMIMDVTISGIN